MAEAAATQKGASNRGITINRLTKKRFVAKRAHGTGTLGTSGLRRSGGWILEEFNHRVAGRRWAQTAREMRAQSPIVGAALLLWESLMLQASWPIEARVPNPSPEQIRVRDFIISARADMTHPFSFHLIEAFTSLTYGWAYCEETYKVRDGKDSKHDDGLLGWKDIALRGQNTLDRWEFSDEDGSLVGMWQTDFWSPTAGTTVMIPIGKAVLYRTRPEKDNPEGNSILRPGWRSYYMAKRLEEIEAIGIERDMAGLPVIQAPPEVCDPNATQENKDILAMLELLVQDIRIDERMGVVMPAEEYEGESTGYKLTLLSTGGRNSQAAHDAIVRHETRLAMSLLAQFLLLGQQTSVGSFALASSATNTLSIALGAYMDTIADTFTTQAIERLCKLNGFPPDTWPWMRHGDVETPPLAEFAAFLSAAGGQGFLKPDGALEDRIREWVGLSPREKDVPVDAPVATVDVDAPAATTEAAEDAGVDVAPERTGDVAETAVASEVAFTGVQLDKAIVIYGLVARKEMAQSAGVVALVSMFGLSEETAKAFLGDAGQAEGFVPAPPTGGA